MNPATLDKAEACVVRERDGATELLVFRHPYAGIQIPKGTVEPGERFEDAVRRELEEESGITAVTDVEKIGMWDRVIGEPADSNTTAGDLHRWHIFLMRLAEDRPETWDHVAVGSDEEDGETFSYFWVPIDWSLHGLLEPLFAATCAVLYRHFGVTRPDAQ